MSRGNSGDAGGPVQGNDPYLEFAGDWAWAMFDRTICTHMRGDEAFALATARSLLKCSRKSKRRRKSEVLHGRNIQLQIGDPSPGRIWVFLINCRNFSPTWSAVRMNQRK